MFKAFYAIWGSLLIASNAFAIKQRDVVRIDYDLQGGTNNLDNITSYPYDDDDLGRINLLPPTKDGYDFLGWYMKSDSTLLYSNDIVSYLRPCDAPYDITSENTVSVYARWGVKAKAPKRDEAGCILVNDAAELYGAVKTADSLRQKFEKVCVSIQKDIVVNKNLLATDGSLNEGNFYWWKPFNEFSGFIEGNGHFISGLFGNVGLVNLDFEGQLIIQNLELSILILAEKNRVPLYLKSTRTMLFC